MPALAMEQQQSTHDEHYMYMCELIGVEPSEEFLKKQNEGPAKVQVLVYAGNCQPPAADLNRLHRQQQQSRTNLQHGQSSTSRSPRISKEAAYPDRSPGKRQEQPNSTTLRPSSTTPKPSSTSMRPIRDLKHCAGRQVPVIAVQQGTQRAAPAPVKILPPAPSRIPRLAAAAAAATTATAAPQSMTAKRTAASCRAPPASQNLATAGALTGSGVPAPPHEQRSSSPPSPRLQHTRVSCLTTRACDTQVPLLLKAPQAAAQVPIMLTDRASTQQQQAFKQQGTNQLAEQSVTEHSGDWQGFENTYRHEQQLQQQQQRAREDEERRDSKAANHSLLCITGSTFRQPSTGAACCEAKEVTRVTYNLKSACYADTCTPTGSSTVSYAMQHSAQQSVGRAPAPASKLHVEGTRIGTVKASSAGNSHPVSPTQALQAPLAGASVSEAAESAPRIFRAPSKYLPPIRERSPYEEDVYIRQLANYEAACDAQRVRAVAQMLVKAAAVSQQQQQRGLAVCGSTAVAGAACGSGTVYPSKMLYAISQGGLQAKPAAAAGACGVHSGLKAKPAAAAGEVHREVEPQGEQDSRSFRDLLRKSSEKIRKLVESLSGKKAVPLAVGGVSI